MHMKKIGKNETYCGLWINATKLFEWTNLIRFVTCKKCLQEIKNE